MNHEKVIVVAPTIAQGRMVAKDFCVNERNVYSNPDMMRGMSERVILLYAGGQWNMQKFDEMRDCLSVGNHTIIMVPEYILR